jgi:DnaK suppressor protein
MRQGVEEVLVRPFLPAYRRGKPGLVAPNAARYGLGVGRRNTEGRMAGVLGDEIDVLAKARRAMPGDYVPSDDEPYMSEPQLDYFRRLLLEWKKSILSASAGTLSALQDGPLREPDLNDRASSETDWGIELRTRDRQRKLIAKIDSAMRRIDEGEYGFCEVTGEPIGLGRLIARPIATMTVEAQEAHERREKISRDM